MIVPMIMVTTILDAVLTTCYHVSYPRSCEQEWLWLMSLGSPGNVPTPHQPICLRVPSHPLPLFLQHKQANKQSSLPTSKRILPTSIPILNTHPHHQSQPHS